MTIPKPVNDTVEPTDAFSLEEWRSGFLRRLLRVALAIGSVFLLATFLTTTNPILRGIYTALFVALLLANFAPLPSKIKSGIFVTILYALGVSGLLETGARGDARVWLIAFVSLSALLLGNRAGLLANGASALAMAIFGGLFLSKRISPINPAVDTGTLEAWVVYTLENIGLSALIAAGITWLERDFQRAQKYASQTFDTLRRERANLENLIKERTADLERRADQLQAAALVAREAATQSELEKLLDQTVHLITERFNFYHTGIFLLDEYGDYVVLRAASSEGGKKMLARGHRLVVGQQGIVGAVAYENRARVALDVSADTAFAHNPDLPLTRAEAAFPLVARDKVIGVLDIQSTSPTAFSPGDVELLQTLADQIALAIQNARLMAETSEALRRLETATAESARRAWSEEAGRERQGYRYTPAGLAPLDQAERPTVSSGGDRIQIPIALRGQKIGNIVLRRREGASWNEADRSLAIEVANQVGLALENARLLDETRRRAAQEQTISELASTLSRTLDPDALLQAAVKELRRLPNVEEVSVFLGAPEPPAASEKSAPHN